MSNRKSNRIARNVTAIVTAPVVAPSTDAIKSRERELKIDALKNELIVAKGNKDLKMCKRVRRNLRKLNYYISRQSVVVSA